MEQSIKSVMVKQTIAQQQQTINNIQVKMRLTHVYQFSLVVFSCKHFTCVHEVRNLFFASDGLDVHGLWGSTFTIAVGEFFCHFDSSQSTWEL